MDQKRIGALIKEKRNQKQDTQKQMAETIGVSEKMVWKWENGKCMPEVSIIQPICKYLSISVTELLNGKESNASDRVLMDLLWVKKKLEAFWTIAFGLFLCNIPLLVESLWSVDQISQDFLRGFVSGSFVGMKFIGICFFARGVALYICAVLKRKW